jgi:hypothetical protein
MADGLCRAVVFGSCCGVGKNQYLFYKHYSLIVMFLSEQPSIVLQLEVGLKTKLNSVVLVLVGEASANFCR